VIAAVTQLGGLIPELPQAPEIQDMYFLGFPYGELFSDLKVEKVVSTSRFLLSKNMKVAGVVSGCTPDLQFVLEPKKIMPGEDLHKVEPWRIVKIKGEKFRLEDTKQMVDTNSGIVRGYAIESAINLIKNHPQGPVVTQGQPPL
jgi:hypothetical protein